MARSKRKLQEDATQLNKASYGKYAVDRLTEFALHLDLRIRESERISLPKVRLDMVERETAKILLELLKRYINA